MMQSVVILAALMSQSAQSEPLIRTAPVQEVTESSHIAAVRYDCTLIDETRNTSRFVFEKRGRMLVVGEYEGYERTITHVEIPSPTYEVLENSDPKFADMAKLEEGERHFIGPDSVLALTERDEFAAIFSFGRPHGNRARLNFLPLTLYLPDSENRNKVQTLSGLCSAHRLEDQTQ